MNVFFATTILWLIKWGIIILATWIVLKLFGVI